MYNFGQLRIIHLLSPSYNNEIHERSEVQVIHYIYCYTNKINNKKYIGQTNNLERRKKQHLQDSIHCHKGHEISHSLPFHAAIRKYGIDNFGFDILEIIDTDNWEDVNNIESKYINQYNTICPNGYNLQAQGRANRGLNKSALPENVIQEIISKLKNKEFIPDIAEEYQLSRSYISDINNGRCLRQENETYPLQQNRVTKDKYLEIIDLIKNTNYSMRKIAEYEGMHRDTIEKINKGHQKIVRALYDGDFPIRKNTQNGYTLKPVETISSEIESRVTIDT